MTSISKYKWPLLAAIALNFVALYIGEEFGFYYRFAYIDKVFHFLGGVVAAWFFFVLLGERAKSFSALRMVLIAMVFVYFVGVVWEFLEYISTVYSPIYAPWLQHYFSIGSWLDSLGDLVADMAGGLIVTLSVLTVHANGNR